MKRRRWRPIEEVLDEFFKPIHRTNFSLLRVAFLEWISKRGYKIERNPDWEP